MPATRDTHAILTPRIVSKRVQYLDFARAQADAQGVDGLTKSGSIAKTGEVRFHLGPPRRREDWLIARISALYPDGVTIADLVQWLQAQRDRRADGRRALARSTVHAYADTLKRYARAALSSDLLYNTQVAASLDEAFRPFHSPARRFSDIEPLSRRELRALTDPSRAGERVAAIVTLLVHTGLRASEAAAITIRDCSRVDRLDSQGDSIGTQWRIKVRGKVEDRSIFCSEDVFAQARSLSGSSRHLIANERGAPYNRQSLYLVLSSAGRRVIGRTIGCHLLRHTYATFMHRSGKDAEAMRQMGVSADVFYSTYIFARPEPLTDFLLAPQVSVNARVQKSCDADLTYKRGKLA
jgi:integrase